MAFRRKDENVQERIRIRIPENEAEPVEDKHFRRTASGYRAAKYVALLLLVAFIVSFVTFSGQSISYANFAYLIKDMESEDTSNTAVNSFDISLEHSASRVFSRFGSFLASADCSHFRLYNSYGTTALEDDAITVSPRLITSKKYALLYDYGSENYFIYNDLARVYTGVADGSIHCASVSDCGSFMIAARSREYKYIVSLYDKSFSLVSNYYKDKYVMDTAISPNGDTVAIISTYVENSTVMSEIMLCKVGSDASVSSTYSGSVAARCLFTDNSTLAVLFDNRVVYCADTGDVITDYTPPASSFSTADVTSGGVVAVYEENAVGSQSTAVLIDPHGSTVQTLTLPEYVTGCAAAPDTSAYLFGRGFVTRLQPSAQSSPETLDTGDDPVDIIPFDSGCVVCYSSRCKSAFIPDTD